MADRTLLRLSATLLVIGAVVFQVGALPEPGAGNAYQAQFAVTATSSIWTALHLGQFVGTATITAGLLALFFALNVREGTPRWLGLFGAIAAGVALALAGVVYAVDGVALKQVSAAWASAPAAEQAARFASAEAIRWLEWGVRSYQNYMFGLALVLFAATIVWTGRVARPVGYIMGLNGLANIVLGWQTGAEGFSITSSALYSGGAFLFLAWMVWLLVSAWRMKASAPAAPA